MTDFTPRQYIIGGIGDGNDIIQNIVLPNPGKPAPYMLPEGRADFTGREDYIAQIERILECGKIAAIDGMGGVGKSALAIHVANRLKDRFPDAQLYVNLLGQTPEFTLEPKTVLISFIRALTGWDESQMATDLDELAAQYRSVLTDKRVLVVLDNARDEAQVRLLLPNRQDCAVLITSRNRLTGLSGAELVDLKPMLTQEAELLFQTVLNDSKRAEAEPTVVGSIVNLCGYLPIAIRIAAATLTQLIWKGKSLAVYAQELAAEETRLSKLENENVERDTPGQGRVRASFNLSYRALTDEDRQLFRWAGGLPGIDFGLQVLAAVMEQQASPIEAGLGRLLEAQVLDLSGDRFSFHDLMRLFAREQLTEPERETVLDRGLNWYCERADFWDQRLNPLRFPQLVQELIAGTENSADELEQSLPIKALDWFTAERKNWVEIVRKLTQIPRPDDAVALAANLAPFFSHRSIWDDWVITHEMVKDCAQKANNLDGVAQTAGNLAGVYENQGKWDEAIALYQKSLDIYHRLGDRLRVATSLGNLGNVYNKQNKWNDAENCYRQSLEIQRQLGYLHGAARSFNSLGILYNKQSQWNNAIDSYNESLNISHQLGDLQGVGLALGNLGNVYESQGKWNEAIAFYNESLEIKRQFGDRYGIAQSLNNLGVVYSNQGQLDEAENCYRQSLEIFQQLEDIYGIASVLISLGNVYIILSKWDDAENYYRQSLEISRQLGDTRGVAQSLHSLGTVYNNQCKDNQAISVYQQSLEIFRQLGDLHGTALTLGNLGIVYDNQGKCNEAIAIYQQSLDIYRQLGDRDGFGRILGNLGSLYANQGELDKAENLCRQSLEIARQLGDRQGVAQILVTLGRVYDKQGKWDDTIACYAQSLEIKRKLGDCHGSGLTLVALGIVHARRNQIEQARILWREALTYLLPTSPEFQTVQKWL